MVTDHAAFRDFVLAQSQGGPFAVNCTPVAASYNTKYERRWSSEGQQEFYEIRFTLIRPSQLSFEEVHVKTRHVERIPQGGPHPENARGEVTVEFKRRLFDPVENVYMLMAVVNEEGLTQTFWIEVHPRETGDWAIRASQGSETLPTVGVQKALDLVYAACLTTAEGG